jgi:hypothetical protein
MGAAQPWQPPQRRCHRCGQLGQMIAAWPIGPVCRACYRKARAHPASCASCSEIRVLVSDGISHDGDEREVRTATICGVCAGSAYTYLCTTCGSGAYEPYKHGECVRCAVHKLLVLHFAEPNGTWPATGQRLMHALAHSRRPRSVLAWLGKPRGGAAVLQTILRAGEPIDHQALDRFPES